VGQKWKFLLRWKGSEVIRIRRILLPGDLSILHVLWVNISWHLMYQLAFLPDGGANGVSHTERVCPLGSKNEISKFYTICHFYIWYFLKTRLNKDASWTDKLKCTSYGKHFLGVFVFPQEWHIFYTNVSSGCFCITGCHLSLKYTDIRSSAHTEDSWQSGLSIVLTIRDTHQFWCY